MEEEVLQCMIQEDLIEEGMTIQEEMTGVTLGVTVETKNQRLS